MISVLCPSRGRPELAKKMLDTAINLAGTKIQVLFYINDDDTKLPEYLNLISREHLIVGPDRSPAYSWNKLAESAQYDILMLQGDDAWFETDNWAVKVKEAFDQFFVL
jgi:hypothetical protein